MQKYKNNKLTIWEMFFNKTMSRRSISYDKGNTTAET